jgi:putative transposase
MESVTTKARGPQLDVETAAYLFDDWFDPIETGLREQVRAFIEELIRSELDTALARPRYARQIEHKEGASLGLVGHRHGSRTRTLTGTFGAQQITVPRARIERPDGTTTEWKSKALRAYQRRTVAADALIASTYLAGTNTRRVRRALVALFGGAVGKGVVSRTWRKSLPRT